MIPQLLCSPAGITRDFLPQLPPQPPPSTPRSLHLSQETPVPGLPTQARIPGHSVSDGHSGPSAMAPITMGGSALRSSFTRRRDLSPVILPIGLPLPSAWGPGTENSCPLSPRAALQALGDSIPVDSTAFADTPSSSQVALKAAFSAPLTFGAE